MLEYKLKRFVDVSVWDQLVKDTYGKPYKFQQQYGCQERGIHFLTIPAKGEDEDMYDSIPEDIKSSKMGVKFDIWLNTDPEIHKQRNNWDDFRLALFWDRNFYPDIQTVANDLHKKGLIEAGDYVINIDW